MSWRHNYCQQGKRKKKEEEICSRGICTVYAVSIITQRIAQTAGLPTTGKQEKSLSERLIEWLTIDGCAIAFTSSSAMHEPFISMQRSSCPVQICSCDPPKRSAITVHVLRTEFGKPQNFERRQNLIKRSALLVQYILGRANITFSTSDRRISYRYVEKN